MLVVHNKIERNSNKGFKKQLKLKETHIIIIITINDNK